MFFVGVARVERLCNAGGISERNKSPTDTLRTLATALVPSGYSGAVGHFGITYVVTRCSAAARKNLKSDGNPKAFPKPDGGER